MNWLDVRLDPGPRQLHPAQVRMRVEHAQILDAGDIPRFARLGLIASMQPIVIDADVLRARLRTDVDSLSAMVDDLFELSRIEAGQIEWSMRQVELSLLVKETIEAMRPEARARQVEVRSELDEHVCGLFPRATWLRLIGDTGFEVRGMPLVHDERRAAPRGSPRGSCSRACSDPRGRRGRRPAPARPVRTGRPGTGREAFMRLVEEAVASIPEQFRERLGTGGAPATSC